ncbi:MAG: peptidylprolyl isomerase [Oscillospiraceae bacterium]|nr:peptidylprolyl isomerase [Oscillospiraceae bacterium]
MKKLLVIPLAASMLLLGGCSLFVGNTYTSQALYYDYSQMEFIQFEEPEEGQTVAVIKTSKGDITAVLYPEYAPNTVDNFVNRANDGYYDNTKIFGIFEGYYAATGSSSEDGTTGASNDGNLIENEYTPKLWPFKGALCSISHVMGYGDSRYMICNTIEFDDKALEEIRAIPDKNKEQLFPDELIEAWAEHGAIPQFSGSLTVFGQVIDGMDVFDEIMSVGFDSETYKPNEDLTIYTVEITEYKRG